MSSAPRLRHAVACLAPALLGVSLPGQLTPDFATPYTITTLAGTTRTGAEDGREARLNRPWGVVADAAGNLYIADSFNSTIRKRSPDGTVTTIAGRAGVVGSADGPGSAARFSRPTGLALDRSGNLYVTDSNSNVIRKISASGVVTTIAGLAGSWGSADGTGASARFYGPQGIAVDSEGTLYVADQGNSTIRKISSSGTVTTLAGSPGQRGSADGIGAAARFAALSGIALDSSGNLFVTDTFGPTIRKVSPTGETTTPFGKSGMHGHVDGPANVAVFAYPTGIAHDGKGNFVVACRNGTLRRISADGNVSTLAGELDVHANVDGPGTQARFTTLEGVTLDSAGVIYVADVNNHAIRRIDPDRSVSTVVGTGPSNGMGYADATGPAARFGELADIAADSLGNLFVSDPANRSIRKVSPAGAVTTFAGSPGPAGSADGSGTTARFSRPFGIAIDGADFVYVTDRDAHVIRKISPAGTVTTLAGSAGSPGYQDGTGANAQFNEPAGIEVDAAGNLLVMDRNNNAVRKVTPAGVVTTLTDNSNAVDFDARFFLPIHLAADTAGNVYVADAINHVIRRITPGGTKSTFAGEFAVPGFTDGAVREARFNYPLGIATDREGNVYVADLFTGWLRRINAAGRVTTLAGSIATSGRIDGAGSGASFEYLSSVTVDRNGSVYIIDASSIRKGSSGSAPTITSQPQSQTVAAGSNVLLSVTATAASGGLTYQWQLNGVAITGATESALRLNAVRTADAGNYSVVVRNASGSVTSSEAILSVTSSSGNPPAGGGSGGGGGGGGGAISPWFLAAVLALAGTRLRSQG